MILQELWQDYLAKTMPVLTAWGVPLVCLQMLGGLPPLISLFHSVRRQNGFDRLLICLTPGIFIVTIAIVQPLFLSSFLGAGFPWAEELKQFLFQPHFFQAALAVVAVFVLLTLCYKRLEQARQGPDFSASLFWAASGAELLAALCLLALSTDYFLHGGGLFAGLSGGAVKWLVYGLFLVLYKSGVLLFCLIWRLLFSERPGQTRTYGQQQAASWRAKGLGWLMFAGLWQFAVVGGLRRDGDDYGWAQAVVWLLAAIGLGCLLFSFWPRKGAKK